MQPPTKELSGPWAISVLRTILSAETDYTKAGVSADGAHLPSLVEQNPNCFEHMRYVQVMDLCNERGKQEKIMTAIKDFLTAS